MEKITCLYKKTLYRDYTQGFAVFIISTKGYDEYRNEVGDIICRGKIPVYTQNIPLLLSGEFILDKRGYIFQVEDSLIYSDEAERTKSYIESCEVKGIGSKLAERISNFVDADFVSFFTAENCVDYLCEKTKIQKDKLSALVEKIRKTLVQKPVYDYLYSFGGSLEDACRLCEMYGSKALLLLKENPYIVCGKCRISFFVADAIARSEGFGPYDENRIISIVRQTFFAMHNSGHTYSPLDIIVGNVNFLAKKSAFVEEIPKELILRAMYTDKRFVLETDGDGKVRYTYIEMYNAEKKIVSEIKRLQSSSKTNDFTRRMFMEVQNEIGIEYSEQQKEAFGSLRSSGIKVITGSPGTGKTTVVNGIIKAFEKINPCGTVSLCAPTGRAAQQMREATRRKASTIHRLIDLKPFEGPTVEEHKITPINSDLVIVDEMSMVDTVLFSLLLSAIKNGALVILCGDSDQLPSVGAGNVLHDIIESEACEVFRLSKIYRQKGTSNIVLNAHRIRENQTEMLQDKDFQIINASSEDEMVSIASALTEEYYDKVNPYKFQILSGVKKGTIGVHNLNKVLQDICNPEEYNDLISCRFRVNDKVMFTVNNYKAGYVNGDIGTVVSTEDDTVVVKVDETEIAVPHSKISDLMLAYSITTHKTQGSEFENVVVILPEQPKIMLQKKLIYTAITRAKKNVIIIAQNDSLTQSILIDEFSKRRTSLKDRLTGKISLVER